MLDEKLLKRQARFGVVTDTEVDIKKQKRAERFGLAPTAAATAANDELKRKRAERFGLAWFKKKRKPKLNAKIRNTAHNGHFVIQNLLILTRFSHILDCFFFKHNKHTFPNRWMIIHAILVICNSWSWYSNTDTRQTNQIDSWQSPSWIYSLCDSLTQRFLEKI